MVPYTYISSRVWCFRKNTKVPKNKLQKRNIENDKTTKFSPVTN